MARALTAVAVVLLCVGCPAHRRSSPDTVSPGTYGIYRAVYEDPEGTRRGFRIMLFAELPDRLRAEVLPPVGGTEMILDAGAGNLALTVVSERTAWVGAADPETIGAVIGVPLDLADLVATILGETEPQVEGVTVRRSPRRVGLPDTLIVESDNGRLELRLRKKKKLPKTRDRPGTGEPPPGVELRSLTEALEDGGPSLFPDLDGGEP
jgi:hypothetical protein